MRIKKSGMQSSSSVPATYPIFTIIMFNVISHRAEILVSLVFAVTADINQMSKVSQQYLFLGT